MRRPGAPGSGVARRPSGRHRSSGAVTGVSPRAPPLTPSTTPLVRGRRSVRPSRSTGSATDGNRTRLPLSEPAGRPLTSGAPSHPPRKGVEGAPARAGATPAVVCRAPGYALVSAEMGVAVVPETAAATAGTGGVRRLEPAAFRSTISVAHRGEESGPAAGSLRALLRSGFARASADPAPRAPLDAAARCRGCGGPAPRQ
ncbi:LysR substrate-binding domain-containing protein [Streptomyces sp. NPDC058434]|uniref:LysR substrate-binding domain-containing protein n=1 Tax=Streptomyces sp. NPDC058434 TaxID=3346498 RepID=UPI003648DD03